MEQSVERHLGLAALALSMDQIPELAHARTEAKSTGEIIMESRRPEWSPGQFEPVILTSDPITAAERVWQAESAYGANSTERAQAYAGALMNSRRALGEAYRRTTWEYFHPIKQTYDSQSGSYQAFGRPALDIVDEGLRWDQHAEERQRLINEFVEEVGNHAFSSHDLADTHWVLTISPCPDHAINHPDEGYGYVPEIKKLMVRGVHFDTDPDSGRTRYIEQAGLSGQIINSAVILRALKQIGVEPDVAHINKTELQGSQFLIDKREIPGILDFIRLLDSTAGPDVFMGEQRTDKTGDYASVGREAKARERLLDQQAKELTDFMLGLAQREADHVWAAAQFEKKLNQLLHDRVKTNPRMAQEAFDLKTAEGYKQAIHLDRLGRSDQANAVRLQVQTEAPPAAFCGAGSCGLRNATPSEIAHARSLGLSGDILALDEKLCPSGHRTLLFGREGKACSRCQQAEVARRRRHRRRQHTKPKTARVLRLFY